jgi:hypothetical protein
LLLWSSLSDLFVELITVESLHLVKSNIAIAHQNKFQLGAEIFGKQSNKRLLAEFFKRKTLHADDLFRVRVGYNHKPTWLFMLRVIANSDTV